MKAALFLRVPILAAYQIQTPTPVSLTFPRGIILIRLTHLAKKSVFVLGLKAIPLPNMKRPLCGNKPNSRIAFFSETQWFL